MAICTLDEQRNNERQPGAARHSFAPKSELNGNAALLQASAGKGGYRKTDFGRLAAAAGRRNERVASFSASPGRFEAGRISTPLGADFTVPKKRWLHASAIASRPGPDALVETLKFGVRLTLSPASPEGRAWRARWKERPGGRQPHCQPAAVQCGLATRPSAGAPTLGSRTAPEAPGSSWKSVGVATPGLPLSPSLASFPVSASRRGGSAETSSVIRHRSEAVDRWATFRGSMRHRGAAGGQSRSETGPGDTAPTRHRVGAAPCLCWPATASPLSLPRARLGLPGVGGCRRDGGATTRNRIWDDIVRKVSPTPRRCPAGRDAGAAVAAGTAVGGGRGQNGGGASVKAHLEGSSCRTTRMWCIARPAPPGRPAVRD